MRSQFMTKDAIEARRRRAREILERNPDLSTDVVRTRTGASLDVVRRIRAEVKARQWPMT